MIPQLILSIANKVLVNGYLLLSICTVESHLKNVNSFTDGHGGSYGICQVNGKLARSINPAVDLLALQQPTVNITIAAIYLKTLESKYDTIESIVSSYNAGHPITGNARYVKKVLEIYKNQPVSNN